MNNFKVEIFENKKWIDYTKKCVFPLKIADFLDEQLDEVCLFMKNIKREYFNPMSIVKITLINNPECKIGGYEKIEERAQQNVDYAFNSNTHRLTETLSKYFLIANDKSTNKPIATAFYEHQLYLIESTKFLEGFIGDSITFTNDLGNDIFFSEKKRNTFTVKNSSQSFGPCMVDGVASLVSKSIRFKLIQTSNLVETINTNLKLDIQPNYAYPQSISIKNNNTGEYVFYQKTVFKDYTLPLKLETFINGTKYEEELGAFGLAEANLPITTNIIQDIGIEISKIGEYTISYEFTVGNKIDTDYTCEALINVVENYYPLKKWTITDVINRCFDLIEPLYYRDKPRFRLSGVNYDSNGNVSGFVKDSLAEKLDKILAPEFSFTQMTLREQLQQIGGFIHGEPRVKDIHFDEDKPWFEIGFDDYGSNVKAVIKDLKNPVTITNSTDINNYATSLDSSPSNVVNQIDYATGVVVEPCSNGMKSLRCETTTVRMGENDNTFISTTLPIYQVKKVTVEYVPNNEIHNGVEITSCIFEKADYDNLSSYEGSYPYAKSHALYYTQGQKNIRGLFFKNEDAIDTATFSRYSIINILRMLTGDSNISIVSHNYPLLSFRVEYIPLYSTRIKTNKQTIISSLPRTINYNQSANIIESRYYGENLKGVISRLGNPEKIYTYNLAFISDIPKIGTKFDEFYYISSVSTEYLPTYIKCTLGLSKNFNRLSEYVGISSNKRMWEVSEKQSQLRQSVNTEYVLITENSSVQHDNTFLKQNPCSLLLETRWGAPVSAMNIFTYSKLKNPITKFNLPVVSSSFGNSLIFTASCEDNYSAGQSTSGLIEFDAKVRGFWGKYVPIGDYYGRFYYLFYQLYAGNFGGDKVNYPSGYIQSGNMILETKRDDGDIGIVHRKDSREIPQITYQIEVVTDNEDIIIGSALTRNCPLVNKNPKTLQLWGFYDEIDKINSKLNLLNGVPISYGFTIGDDYLKIPKVEEGDFKSWALLTSSNKEKIKVQFEDGSIDDQEIITGGELVLGQNKSLTESRTLFFRRKRNIYE